MDKTKALKRWTCALGMLAAESLPVLAQKTPKPYELNVVLSTTGSAAFLGKGEQQVLHVEEKMVNASGGLHGRPIHLVFHDDQSNPQVALQAARQILATQPKAILGSDLVAQCNSMAPLMRNGPVVYCLSPGIHPPPGSDVFSSSVSTRLSR